MARVHLAFMIAIAVATASASGADTMTESQFLERVDGNHPAFQVLDEAVGRARAELARAAALDNPVLEFEHESPADGFRQITWALRWQPPLDGRYRARKASAQSELEAARNERHWSDIERRAELRAHYAAWAIASERESFMARCVSDLRELAGRVDQRARAGEESELNARRIGLVVLEVEVLAALTSAERVEAEGVIAAWLGGDASSSPVVPSLPELPGAISIATHPRVVARRNDVSAAESRHRLGRRFVEFPELFAGWQTITETGSESGGWVFGMAWPVPFFDRGQADRQEARAALSGAAARLTLEEAGLAARLTAATERYRTLRAAAASAAASIADAEDVIASATTMFQLGESTLTDLLDTIRTVVSARHASLDLHDATLAAHRSLELAAGRPLTANEGDRP